MDRFQEAKLRIKERVDLAELVSGYLSLTRRGRYFLGLCPFHRENTPSFTVYVESQHYKCFGCGAAGDVFTFLTQREGLTFREAFTRLAERSGVSLEGVFAGRAQPEGPSRNAVHEVLTQVRDFFEERLWSDACSEQRRYLESRGLLPAVEDFGLGAHPAPGQFLAFARERKLPRDVLLQAGLLREDGSEPMARRVMFAITDERGQVVGFGGRALPGMVDRDGNPVRDKYRNSPESPFFNKRRLLYGLRQVKRAGAREIVVVEGYVDVIALHLAGFHGAVASLGTALTPDHARLLELYATEGVVLLFDGDRAGRKAADRAFRELVHTNLPIRIGLLPEGRDPDDLVGIAPGVDPATAAAGRDQLRDVIARAGDAVGTWFALKRKELDLAESAVVAQVARDCGTLLGTLTDRARRERLRVDMARHLGVHESAIVVVNKRATEAGSAAPSPPPPQRVDFRQDPLAQADLEILVCVLGEPSLLEDAVALPGDRSTLFQRVVDGVAQARKLGAGDRPALLRDLFARYTDDPVLTDFLHEAAERAARARDVRGMFQMLRRDRESRFARQQAQRILQQAKQAKDEGDQALADRLARDYHELMRRQHLPPGAMTTP
ncbi:MAG: DNA primase [Planctomycetota bacterium]